MEINGPKTPSDASEQDKSIENMLHTGDQLFRVLVEQSSDIILVVNRKGVIIYENNAVENILGFKAAQRIGGNIFDNIHPDELTFVKDAFLALFEQADAPPQKNEIRIRDIHDQWLLFEIVAGNLIYHYAVQAIIVQLRLITQSKQTEKIIRESERRYRLLADHMKDQVWLMDLNFNVMYISPSVEKTTGYSLDDLKVSPLKKILPEESFKKAMDFMDEEMPKALAAPSNYILNRTLELELLCNDGRRIWGEIKFSLIRNQKGKPVSILIEGRDITERRQMEEALRESEARHREQEERYRNILDNMEEAYYEVDLKGSLTFFNAAAVANLGYTNSEMMGMNFHQYVDEENVRKLLEGYNWVFRTGESIKELDWEILSKNLGKISVESSISLMRNEQGQPIGFRGIIRDISERKKEEKAREKLIEELRQALSEVKTLSGLLPICASCKKIRNDKGYWEQIESFIGEHSEAEFSHGICPDCAKKLYPEYIKKPHE
ncbi:MAG: PAS domain S-box protein [Syntrophaceae bacterium]|jgi:PAS domain S-box-containing protein|nr:PAS domain S-box protein [Syntrophaceae bacterium]HOC59655.1 PAS domain S-box protein [Smithellaceae bacterium]HQM45498.1 PAS domain S-box protein [Smithellaceae bacterium]